MATVKSASIELPYSPLTEKEQLKNYIIPVFYNKIREFAEFDIKTTATTSLDRIIVNFFVDPTINIIKVDKLQPVGRIPARNAFIGSKYRITFPDSFHDTYYKWIASLKGAAAPMRQVM